MMARIEAERKRAGMSQEKLAHKVGVTLTTYQNWKRGSKMTAESLGKIANVLGCSMDYLMGKSERREIAV